MQAFMEEGLAGVERLTVMPVPGDSRGTVSLECIPVRSADSTTEALRAALRRVGVRVSGAGFMAEAVAANVEAGDCKGQERGEYAEGRKS